MNLPNHSSHHSHHHHNSHHPRRLPRYDALVMLLLALAAVLGSFYWINLGRPVAMVEAPTDHIACVSYAPFRKSGESPFEPIIVPQARIDEDLKALSQRFDCVRTYAQGNGLNVVPEVARRYGMKVLLGIWLGRDEAANAREIAKAAQTVALDKASGAPVIRALVVGNEVMLRGELTQAQLVADIRKAAAATNIPVTYADVWEFWLKYPDVQNAVSFITIHILPYWEDAPVPIEQAVPHVKEIYDRMQARFPDKKLLIGETGWPSAGRERWGAVPSLVNQARFFREFMQFAAQSHVDYNVIEAFDQPWKRVLEGTVGGYWGIYDGDLHDKFPQHGPVTEDTDASYGLMAGLGFAVVLMIAAWLIPGIMRPRYTLKNSLLIIAALGYSGGIALAAQWRHMLFANRTSYEWSIGLFWTILEVITIILGTLALARVSAKVKEWVGQAAARPPLDENSSVNLSPNDINLTSLLLPTPLSQFIYNPGLARWLGLLRCLWLIAASVVCLLLIMDARYRDFPIWMFAPPAFIFLLLRAAAHGARQHQLLPISNEPPFWSTYAIEEKVMAAWLIVSAVYIIVLEKISNENALIWGAVCLVLAACSCTSWNFNLAQDISDDSGI